MHTKKNLIEKRASVLATMGLGGALHVAENILYRLTKNTKRAKKIRSGSFWWYRKRNKEIYSFYRRVCY